MFHLFSFSIFTDMNIGHNAMVPFKWNLLRSNSTMYYNLFSTHGSNFWVSVIQTKPFQHYFHIVPCIINSSFYLVRSFLIPVEKYHCMRTIYINRCIISIVFSAFGYSQELFLIQSNPLIHNWGSPWKSVFLVHLLFFGNTHV